MVAGNSFTNLYGTGPIVPAHPSYSAISISVNTSLVWPQETTGGTPYVARQLDVSATAPALNLLMPPGNTGSTGAAMLVTNVGAQAFQITDQAGTLIASIATTQTWLITLTSNATSNGTWRGYQMASTVSTATSAALAGLGLQALGPLLQGFWDTRPLSVNTLITSSYRSSAIIWNSGIAGVMTLDTIANLTPGWYAAFTNQGTVAVTLSTSGGNTINGAGSISIVPGGSGIVVAGAAGFNTVAAQIGVVPVSSGGTGATTATQALVNLGGTTLGTSIFTAPDAATIIALLGLTNSTFSERTVSTPQTLAANSTNTAFVGTGAVTYTLPLTTTLPLTFVVLIYGQGGIQTLTPQASDKINGLGVGVSLALPSGSTIILFTDTAGQWWTTFGPAISGTTLTLTGAITAASLAATGAVTAASVAANGLVSGNTGAVATSLTVGTTLVVSGTSTMANVNAQSMTATNLTATGTVLLSGAGGLSVTFNCSLNGSVNIAGSLIVGAGVSASSANITGAGGLTVGFNCIISGVLACNAAGTALTVPTGSINIAGSSSSGSVTGWYLVNGGVGPATLTLACGILCTTNMTASGFFAVSDIRVKEEIKTLKPVDGETFIRKAKPKTYFKRGRYEAGLIAQDQVVAGYAQYVAMLKNEAMPEYIDEDGNVFEANIELNLNMANYVAYLIASEQKLYEEVDTLKGLLADLMARLDKLDGKY